MATFTWEIQGGTATEIDATDKIQFAAATFDSKITVDAYNDSTHVKTDIDGDKSAANSPKNNKYIAAGTVSIDGGATSTLSDISEADSSLKINFAHTATDVEVEDAIFYAYDGTTPATAAVGVVVQAAERTDASWTAVGGNAAALALDNKTVAGQTHDYFIPLSAKPTSVGAKSGKLRMELTYF